MLVRPSCWLGPPRWLCHPVGHFAQCCSCRNVGYANALVIPSCGLGKKSLVRPLCQLCHHVATPNHVGLPLCWLGRDVGYTTVLAIPRGRLKDKYASYIIMLVRPLWWLQYVGNIATHWLDHYINCIARLVANCHATKHPVRPITPSPVEQWAIPHSG